MDWVKTPGSAGTTSPVIDMALLSRHSMGDDAVVRDVLSLFLDQSARVLRAIWDAPTGPARRDAAHLLVGSAMAVGAVQVAEAARRLEAVALQGEAVAMDAIAALHAAVAEARAVVAGLIEGGPSGGL
ncbi:Hpt domain-containing protein [Alsobacter sp. SYSU M60028]|uniref:Hpt domain-containing protein n=1 Tax=Alsobacter ponti TaxID=2962936 RepID=A0ABT1L770_9HYPH|nr:Hpt domain-containing protein [Alsobacter ponti]MCP8937294.1 Hpt domain-containing protein [Alsobacter ponti]